MNRYVKRLKQILWDFQTNLLVFIYSLIAALKLAFFQYPTLDGAKLEIGAGNSKKEGFITLDVNSNADFYFDLMMGLPFKENCFSLIYSEHVFEHFYYNNLLMILQECRRCLKPGGKLSLVVPNARLYLEI